MQIALLWFAGTTGLPAPQNNNEVTEKADDYGDYYGDFDEESATVKPEENTDLANILKAGAGLAEGFLALLNAKVKFINRLVEDKVSFSYYHVFKILGNAKDVLKPVQDTQIKKQQQGTLIDSHLNDTKDYLLSSFQELRSQVQNTVSAGLNFTGQVAKAAAPVVQVAIQSVNYLMNSNGWHKA